MPLAPKHPVAPPDPPIPPDPPVPPSAQYEQPISPPLKSLPHHQPPRKNKSKGLVTAIIFGTGLTAIMGLILKFVGISVNVIWPVLAPIWVGTITLIYSVNAKN